MWYFNTCNKILTIDQIIVFNCPKYAEDHKIPKNPRLHQTKENIGAIYQDVHFSISTSTIAGGDFNSKHPVWSCRSNYSRGKILHKIITNHKWLHLAPIGPTYWPTHINKHPDIMEIFIHPSYTHHNLTF